jgi:hypothetical protein
MIKKTPDVRSTNIDHPYVEILPAILQISKFVIFTIETFL